MNLNYQMDHIQYQIFRVILRLFLKSMVKVLITPSIEIYVSKIGNKVTFKIKNGYYLEVLTPETMKLLGSTESKITGEKKGENVPNLEIVDVPNKPFDSLLEISPSIYVFLKAFNSE